MKTIEKRAKDSVYWDCDTQEYDVAVNQYLKGATEQRRIDREYVQEAKYAYYDAGWDDAIEKACEWLEKYMERLGYIDEWCRNGEDNFRKAMEEDA